MSEGRRAKQELKVGPHRSFPAPAASEKESLGPRRHLNEVERVMFNDITCEHGLALDVTDVVMAGRAG